MQKGRMSTHCRTDGKKEGSMNEHAGRKERRKNGRQAGRTNGNEERNATC
jgi:hypothetical protein